MCQTSFPLTREAAASAEPGGFCARCAESSPLMRSEFAATVPLSPPEATPMKAHADAFQVSTRGKGTYEITEEVARIVRASGAKTGTTTVALVGNRQGEHLLADLREILLDL